MAGIRCQYSGYVFQGSIPKDYDPGPYKSKGAVRGNPSKTAFNCPKCGKRVFAQMIRSTGYKKVVVHTTEGVPTSAKQELAARVEKAWGKPKLWPEYEQIVRHRDAIVAAIDKLKDSFYEEFEKVTGEELVLDQIKSHTHGELYVWGIRVRNNFVMEPNAFERLLPGAMQKLFGHKLSLKEYQGFLDMVTAGFEEDETQGGNDDEQD